MRHTSHLNASVRIGELINGYRVCPANCDIFEVLEEKTENETASISMCPYCGRCLEFVRTSEVVFYVRLSNT